MLECKSNYIVLYLFVHLFRKLFKFFFSGDDVNGDHEIDNDEFLILVTKKLILATVENYFRDWFTNYCPLSPW